MSKYTTYMMKFSQSELRGYLGQGMVDLLIEWLPNGDTLLTKQRMISMIDSIYGTSILKDKNFRTMHEHFGNHKVKRQLFNRTRKV